MKILAVPTPAAELKTPHAFTVSRILAGIFILLAVAQLFTFEKFPDVIAAMLPTDGASFGSVDAALLVTAEVFAVPFLLRMRTSPLMRVVSMLCGWLAAATWLAMVLLHARVANSGLLGATIVVPGSRLLALPLLLVVIGLGYVSWGMWPSLRRK